MRAPEPWLSIGARCPVPPRVTKTAVTDEDSVAAGHHWHSLSNVFLTNMPVTDEGITALLQCGHSLSNV